MRTNTKPLAWWKSAPNPECAPFCTAEHKPDEFTDGGALNCRHVIATTAYYDVEICRMTDANDQPDSFDRSEVTVYFELHDSMDDLLEMTPEAARQFGMGLHIALSEAAHLAEEANR